MIEKQGVVIDALKREVAILRNAINKHVDGTVKSRSRENPETETVLEGKEKQNKQCEKCKELMERV